MLAGGPLVSPDEFLANPSESGNPSVVLLHVAAETLQRWKEPDPRFYDFYFVCFSKHDDLLSQWRAYGADARGYSIGFSHADLQQLRPKCGESDATVDLLKVIYNKDDQLAMVRAAVGKETQLFDNVMPALPVPQRADYLRKHSAYLFACLIRLAVHFKHDGFECFIGYGRLLLQRPCVTVQPEDVIRDRQAKITRGRHVRRFPRFDHNPQ